MAEEPKTIPDDQSKRTRPRVYGPHQLKKTAKLPESGVDREVPSDIRPAFESVLEALGGKLKKGEEFMSAPHIERVMGELVDSGKVGKHVVPVLKSFAVAAHDMVAKPEFFEKGKELAKKLDERYMEVDEGAISPLKPEKSIVEKVMRGKYTGKRDPAPRYESSLPPKFADFVKVVLSGDVGKKFANAAIKKQMLAGSTPIPVGRREKVVAPLTRMMALGNASKLLEKLSPAEQQILKLTFRQKQNIYDIAEAMAMSPREVKRVLEAAKKKVGREFQQKEVSPVFAARARKSREKRISGLTIGGKSASERIESRQKGEETEPYVRVGPMEASPRVLNVDPKVWPLKMPVTSSGKPLDYIDKKTGRPKFYTKKQLEDIYHPPDETPVLGAGAPDVSITKVFRWNDMAREGSTLAAIKLARWKNSQYGKRQMQKSETRVQMKKDWRTGKWVPKTKLDEKTGKQVPVEKFETPSTKARKRNRNESRELGVTGSDVASMATAGKLRSNAAVTEQSKNPIDILRRRFAENKVRKGYSGPFERHTEAMVQRMTKETTPEMLASHIEPRIRRKLRSGVQGPLEARDEDRVRRLAMKILGGRVSKMEEESRTPTGRGIHGEIYPNRGDANEDEKREENVRNIEARMARKSKVVDRLYRIRKALGRAQYDAPIGPEPQAKPRVIHEVNAELEEAPEAGKAKPMMPTKSRMYSSSMALPRKIAGRRKAAEILKPMSPRMRAKYLLALHAKGVVR